MHLADILQEALKGLFTPDQIKDAVSAVKDTTEFREIIKVLKYNSSERHEKNGTLMFIVRLPDGETKEYGIYADGTVRYYTKMGTKNDPGRAVMPFKSDERPKQLIDVYRDRLARLKHIADKKVKKSAESAEYGFPYVLKGLSEEEAKPVLQDLAKYFKFGGTVTIYPERRVKFTGRIDLKRGGSLDRLPVTFLNGDNFSFSGSFNTGGLTLKSLEGLPPKVKNLSLDSFPESWEHFPEVTNLLTVKIDPKEKLLGPMHEMQKRGITNVVYLIKGNYAWNSPEYKMIQAAGNIMTRWLPHGKEGISKAQNELIDIGLIDAARF